jgi:hypothetical protein
MADDVLLNAGTGGDTIAADDILGVKYQRVKLSLGADGAAVDAVAGAGAVSTAVQRVTLASDDPAVTALQVIDDWDESDRAKVNLIVGQAGIAAGAGAVGVTVPRVTHASDDPAVVALQLIDNAVSGSGFNITQLNGVNVTMGNGASGTGVQRVTLASDSTGILAAVTNVATIGTSVTPGTAAANLGKAVDAVAGAADTGTLALAVRDDALSTLTPADGDYTQFRVDSTGAQWVRIASGSIAGIVDDAAFTPATSEVLPIGFQADETAADSVDEGDCGAARMSLDRKQYVIAHSETNSVYQNGTARTPTFVAISGATSGDNTLLAAAGAGNKIRVLSLYLVAAGTTTVRFESGAGGTALSGAMSLIANTGFVLPYSPVGHFETAANTLLNMELNAAVQVSGGFTYIIAT